MFFEHFHHFPEHPVSVSDQPFTEDIFPNIHLKP